MAGALSDVASEFRASLVARLGGDEFCIVLPAGSLAEAEKFAYAASREIARELGDDVSLCWGGATRGAEVTTAHELIATAERRPAGGQAAGPSTAAVTRGRRPHPFRACAVASTIFGVGPATYR